MPKAIRLLAFDPLFYGQPGKDDRALLLRRNTKSGIGICFN